MKVFISHKQEDSSIALDVLTTLKSDGVDAYLDLLDGNLSSDGKQLTQHIKKRLNECTDLLVIISEKTKYSQWVPFEVGMASERDFPIVNYLKRGIVLPGFLEYWPRLKDINDLHKYVSTKGLIQESINKGYKYAESNTDRFYKQLKAVL